MSVICDVIHNVIGDVIIVITNRLQINNITDLKLFTVLTVTVASIDGR